MDVYRTSQVAEILDVSTSTLRKYCLTIEGAGAAFTRDERQERLFTQQDIAALKGLRKMISGGRSTQYAAEQTAILLNAEKEARADAGELVVKDDRALFQQMASSIELLTEQIEALRREQTVERAQIKSQIDADVVTELKEQVKALREELQADSKRGLFSKLFGR